MSYHYGKLIDAKSKSKMRDYVLHEWPLRPNLPDMVSINDYKLMLNSNYSLKLTLRRSQVNIIK